MRVPTTSTRLRLRLRRSVRLSVRLQVRLPVRVRIRVRVQVRLQTHDYDYDYKYDDNYQYEYAYECNYDYDYDYQYNYEYRLRAHDYDYDPAPRTMGFRTRGQASIPKLLLTSFCQIGPCVSVLFFYYPLIPERRVRRVPAVFVLFAKRKRAPAHFYGFGKGAGARRGPKHPLKNCFGSLSIT